MASNSQMLERPSGIIDLLQLPLLDRILRWRWGRLIFQLLLFVLAALIIFDGFTGTQIAAANNATVLAWVLYRGLIILALMLIGNLFCFGCPFTLPRTLAKRFSLFGNRWPRALRNKWLSILGLFLMFWLYEWADLWASPLLTAWIAVAYFVGSFILEGLFSESPFCKYVCPLGAFNFVYSTISPLQISARDSSICRECEGKECVNGSEEVLGCGTELFVPTIRSNFNCTFCLDCSRACPYNNVALRVRKPFEELIGANWPHRLDFSFLVVSLTFMGLMNAFGMVSPVSAVHAWLNDTLSIHSEGLRLLIIFSIGNLALPGIFLLGGSWLSTRLTLSQKQKSPLINIVHYAPAFVPMGFGIWLAHYGFHFAIGGLSVIPVMHSFLIERGISWLGTNPNWSLSYLLPAEWIFPIQVLSVMGGFFAALYLLARLAYRIDLKPIEGLREMLPWALILLVITISVLAIFNLPMEMRGSMMMGS